jgi:zinc protease
MSHEDFPAVELALRALTLPPRARLRAALVGTGLASSVGWETRISRHPDLALISVTATSAATLDSARNVLHKALDGLRDYPPTDPEIDAARPAAGPRITAGAAAECELAGDWRLCLLRDARIRATTADQVRRAATMYLVPWNRTVGVSVPGAGEIGPVTATGDPAAIVSRLTSDDTASADGERFDPSLDNIGRRLVRARLPVGLELALLPKRTREQSVVGVLSLSFGDAQSLIGKAAAAEVVSRLLLAGTKRRSGAELAAELRRLNATVSVTSMPRPTLATVDEFIDLTERGLPWRGLGIDVRFRTTRAQLAPLLSLLAEVLRTPALDSSEFETLRRRQLTVAESRVGLSNPDYLFAALVAGLPGDHPERVADIDDRRAALARLTLAEARAFHAQFYGAGTGVLTLVGDYDPDSVRAQATVLLGNWTSPTPARPMLLVRAASRSVDSAVTPYPGSSRGSILTGAVLPVGPGDADYPALVIANSILGGGVSSRLFSNLRERDGLSYSVASRLRPRATDSMTLWSIEASYELVNAARVREAIRRELDDALRAGFTADEVEVARSGYLARQRLRRASDAALADLLATTRIEDLAVFEQRVMQLTPAAVNAVFRKFIAPDQLTTVRVTDRR